MNSSVHSYLFQNRHFALVRHSSLNGLYHLGIDSIFDPLNSYYKTIYIECCLYFTMIFWPPWKHKKMNFRQRMSAELLALKLARVFLQAIFWGWICGALELLLTENLFWKERMILNCLDT